MSPNVEQAPADSAVVGLVLAGGRSLRFEGEKAAATLAGTALILLAARRLQRSCPVVAANVRHGTESEGLARAAGLPLLYDLPGDALGPLAGVKVGLAWARDQGARALAVSPCDAPLLPDDLFARLIAAAGSGAALAETAEGAQPLCALWPVSALVQVTEALQGGNHPPTWRLLQSLGAMRVRFSDARAFANINTRADLAAIAGHRP
ncbi:MAG TPA: molybdenum cofactor guanylyltransferase [Steroidobacteraceae bacterium]|nr:molybdenum cofactor guanylyltransferase [Steroidobacteraceae bacterium]